MSIPLVPNSVTLDDLERRNSHIRIVISPNSVRGVAECSDFGRVERYI